MRELSASAVPEPLEEVELVDAAAQVSAWCGEPLLYDGDDPAMTLAPGTARRRALDAAREEIAAGLKEPSSGWRFRFSLMLGLERVLATDPPALANGLVLRPHQVDALAGMLAALTSSEERDADADDAEAESDEYELNGETEPAELEAQEDDDGERRGSRRRGRRRGRLRRLRRRGRGGLRGGGGPGSGRDPALPLQASDRFGQDRRGRRVRRGLPHGRRADPDPPPAARRPVHARPQGAGLRPAPDRRDREGQAPAAPAAGHDRDLRLVHQARGRHPPGRLWRGHLRRGAHRPRRANRRDDPALQPTDLHRHDGHRPASAEARRRRVPGGGGGLPAGRRGAPRRGRAAAGTAGQARRQPAQRSGRGRRLRSARAGGGARPRGAQHGRCDALSRPLRPPCGHRLRGGRGSRRARGCCHARSRPARPLRQWPHAAARARGDACRLRARRHQRARQRPAPGGGLERAARHDLHAPGSDGQPSRLPAAHRPRHAVASSQGSRRRRRLRRSVGAALRAHGHAAQPARRGSVQAGCARHPEAAATATALAAPGAAGAAGRRMADPGDGRPGPPPRGHRGALEDRRCRPPAARRAGVLGRDGGAARRAHGPPTAGGDAREGGRGDAHPLLRNVRGGVQAPLAAADRAGGSRGAPSRCQHDRPHGAPDRGRSDVGQRPRSGRPRAARGDRRRHAARLAITASRVDVEAGASLA